MSTCQDLVDYCKSKILFTCYIIQLNYKSDGDTVIMGNSGS